MEIVRDLTNNELIERIEKLESEVFKKEAYSKKELENMILDQSYTLIVDSFIDMKGYLLLHDSYDLFEIMKICVDKNYRGLNIGKKLIEYYLKFYDKNLFLEVREGNSVGRSFYKSLSFQEVGLRKRYYSDGENAILMMLERN